RRHARDRLRHLLLGRPGVRPRLRRRRRRGRRRRRRTGEHGAADRDRPRRAGPDADVHDRELERVADLVPLPVAALRQRRCRVPGDLRRNRPDVPGRAAGRRADDPGRGDGDERRRRLAASGLRSDDGGPGRPRALARRVCVLVREREPDPGQGQRRQLDDALVVIVRGQPVVAGGSRLDHRGRHRQPELGGGVRLELQDPGLVRRDDVHDRRDDRRDRGRLEDDVLHADLGPVRARPRGDAQVFGSGQANGPAPVIDSPASTLTWKVGDDITFSGHATDPQDGNLPASALSWQVLLHHCDPTGQTCHIHFLSTFTGVASGHFAAPDHDYPSYLELDLTATDSQGLSSTTSVLLQPKTVALTIATAPSGLQASFDAATQAAPYTVTAIIGSSHSVSAPTPQTLGGTTYTFSSWSDGGAAAHNITAPATATTYTATYTASGGGNSPPTAVATGSPTSGNAPLTVNFDGSGSSDPDAGDTITYSWDLNGDGTFGDSTIAKPSFVYTTAGTYNAVLKVTDNHGASSTSTPVTITVGGAATTFGTTTVGSGIDNPTGDWKEVSKYTAPRAANVSKLTGYISAKSASTGTQRIRAVLYADSGGNPGALLGVSNEVTVRGNQAWAWVDFNFPSQVAIPAGRIWMGYMVANSSTGKRIIQLRYSTVSGDEKYNLNSGGYSGGPSNPFGTASTASAHYSLYGTYGS